MDAWERADAGELTALLREDARWAMPPAPLWFDGRAAIVRLFALFPIDWQGRGVRMLPTAANRQPAAACVHPRRPARSAYRLAALHVLRIEDGQIAEVTTFGPRLCCRLRPAGDPLTRRPTARSGFVPLPTDEFSRGRVESRTAPRMPAPGGPLQR